MMIAWVSRQGSVIIQVTKDFMVKEDSTEGIRHRGAGRQYALHGLGQ